MRMVTDFLLQWKDRISLFSALILAGMLLIGGGTARAQGAKLRLTQLDKLASKATDVTNVNLEGPMLQLAAQQMSAQKATPAANMLRRLKGIYVKVFEFAKSGQYSKADVESVVKQLQSGGWKPMVNVKEAKSGETTDIYVMEEGGEAVGMAIVAAQPKELVIVNLVGPINFKQLGALGGLGSLGSLGGVLGTPPPSKPQLQNRAPEPTAKNK
jgi:hypothetical protein